MILEIKLSRFNPITHLTGTKASKTTKPYPKDLKHKFRKTPTEFRPHKFCKQTLHIKYSLQYCSAKVFSAY